MPDEQRDAGLPEYVASAIKEYHAATYKQANQERQVGPPAFVPTTEYATIEVAILRYGRASRARALEEAALAAEAAHPDNVYGSLHYSYHATKKTVGDAIRALAAKDETKEGT
jgi:hypothetical protein